MALTFDPFREMDRMAARLLTSGGTQRSASWMPMDLYRSDDHYVVNVDLPGVDPGSIDLDVDANTLTIQAERTIGASEGTQWLAQERPAGRYIRQLGLGSDVDLEKIQATYEHGVLMLTIPVAERAKPRKITIEQGSGQTAIDADSQEGRFSSSTSESSSPA
ncbi:Hsp20/alpha crystallin family protein [Agrococcus sp. Ld7]|uniref:Hsp20/alpha crystallin family protein n=1 Tax=Agrococcus sp. Ld7 TaxID=649148 RepID=UPI00386BA5C1